MYYQKNREVLAKNPLHQSLLSRLDQVLPSEEAMLVPTEAGDYSLLYKGVSLHALTGAEAEAKAAVEKTCRSGNKSHHFIFGLGLGYLLQATYEATTGMIYLYESDLALLRFVLENVDLSECLSRRVFLSTSSAQLRETISAAYTYGDQVDVLYLDGYAALWGSELTRLVKEELMGVIYGKRSSVKTIFSYQQDWNRQYLHNARYFPQSEPFTPLQNHFRGRPAIVISAGPSLENELEDIRQIQDKAVLLVVGSALRAVVEAGIKPDFALFLDFGGPAKQLFGLEDAVKDMAFMVGPFAEDISYRVNAKRLFQNFLVNYRDYSLWLEEQIGPMKPEMLSGGTVSMLAFQSALSMGCEPIILAGQDLALRGTQLYAGGVKGNLSETGELVMDDSDAVFGKRMELLDVQGQNGEILKSPPDYAQYICEFVEMARRYKQENPGKTLYNASIGGAYLAGYEHLSIAKLRKKLSFEPFDKSLPDPGGYTMTEKTRRCIQNLTTLLSVIKDCLKMATEAIDYLEPLTQGVSQNERGTNYEIRYLTLHKQFHQRLRVHGILSHMLQPQVWTLIRRSNTVSEKYEDILENYETEKIFYKEVLNVLGELVPIIEETVACLEKTEIHA
ncbi:MAG: 6-hydroxymethylpterin diphosphokinase MptE-like protein [Vampirovibrionales bacterium]|nr:6-hydroxymethylpterin diphosphokinase MptE-like protein [Vampirovibrionales bacterium]